MPTPSALASSAHIGVSPLAAISLALTAATASFATQAQEATTSTASQPRELSKLVAKAVEEDAIKVDKVASPKFTQPLVDTPQTITVVTQQVLQQQGASTLIEALRNTPGITLQLGENGNTSAGDTFSLRGVASQTNTFVDGMRDLSAVTRDIFNIQQVEIAKGSVGADYGRGAIAGYVNLISNLPVADDFGSASVSAYSEGGVRGTSALNYSLGANSALRLDAMWQNRDAVGRDVVENHRWGVAPGIAFGLDTATRFYFYSQHVRHDNVPDGGIPTLGLPGFYNARLASNTIQPRAVDRDNFYGRFDDYENMSVDMGTLRIEHDFANGANLRNSTRYGKSEIERVLTGVSAFTDANFPVIGNLDTWTVTRNRQAIFQENELLTNQTNLSFGFKTGIIEHDLASGIELIKEQQYSPAYAGLGTLPNANLYHPNPADNFTSAFAPARTAAFSDGQTITYSGYVFDTLKVGDRWQFTAGVRYDNYDTDFIGISITTLAAYPTLPVGTLLPLKLNDSGNLLSWKTAVLFKPASNGSIYFTYADSRLPPGGSNFVLADPNAANTTTNINRPGLDPQKATNIELGTKWDLLDARLALTAALYRTENRNEISLTDATSLESIAYGKRRIQGAEFGVVGKLTDNWQLIAGLAWSDNEVVSGSSGNNTSGAPARWAPEYSANLWTTYNLGKWSAALGVIYVDEQKRIVDPALPANINPGVPAIPGYTVFDGALGYAINDSVNLQLNVRNLADKLYISTLNNSGARVTLGAPRSAQLTANYKF